MTDYLTCGQCFREFPLQGITTFIQHKKLNCDDQDRLELQSGLQCGQCPRAFVTAWALLMHAQIAHNLQIFLENAATSLLNKHTRSLGESQAQENQNIATPEVKEFAIIDTSNASRDQAKTFSSGTNIVNSAEGLEQATIKSSNLPITASLQKNASPGQNLLIEDRDVKSQKTVIMSENIIENTVAKLSPINPVMSIHNAHQTIAFGQSSTPMEKQEETILFAGLTSESAPKTTSLTITDPPISLISSNLNKNIISPTTTWVNKMMPVVRETRANSPVQPVPVTLSASKPARDLITTPVALNIPLGLKTPLLLEKVSITDNKNSLTLPDDGATITNSTHVETKEGQEKIDDTSMESECGESCEDQGCGVTVIPGSHEGLKECCSAVVPKKRKRHMMQKHMPFALSSSRYASRKLLYRSRNCRPFSSQYHNKASSSSTIYIDLKPNSLMGDEQSLSIGDIDQDTGFNSSVSQNDTMSMSTSTIKSMSVEGGGKQRSLILKPGAVFSIPITYTLPASVQDVTRLQGTSKGTLAEGKEVLFSQPSLTIASTSRPNKTETREMIRSSILSRKSLQSKQLETGSKKSSGSRKEFGGKPFQCDKCTSAFNQRIHLKKHMSKHTGIKPYKCDECNYSTVERSHLKVHIRIHTGEKPFKCTFCEYATAQNSTLKIHLKRHHGGKMFQCNLCNKQFTQQDQLKGHLTEHEDSATPCLTTLAETSVNSLSGPSVPSDCIDTSQPAEDGGDSDAEDSVQSGTSTHKQVKETATNEKVTDPHTSHQN